MMRFKISILLLCAFLQLFATYHAVHAQSQGDIRLTNNDNGYLEVFYDGVWGSICDDGWTDSNAQTVCRILGYEAATYTTTGQYDSNIDYKLLYIDCDGSEANLLNCTYELYSDYDIYSFSYCSSYEHIYIACGSIDTCRSYLLAADSGLSEVEFYNESIFYFVCYDGFTYENAEVVCRENTGTLFANRNSISLSSINSTNQILNSIISCNGYENSLCECPQSTGVSCSSNLIVQIQCEPQVNGNVRANPETGLLEIYIDGWGYVCDDYWGTTAADTVCRQLGHRRSMITTIGNYYNNEDFKIDDVLCRSNLFHIDECSYITSHNCYSGEHVEVYCESDGCESLTQNDTVYIYDVNQWQYVCADQMTPQIANVICKESYNSSASNYTSILMSSANYDFPIVGYSFNCSGSESSLCECQRVANSCSSMEIVQVSCNTPGDGRVRLTNGGNGLLEVYYDGEWGYVCDDGWIETNGDVVCSTLGYEDALSSSAYHYSTDLNYRLNFINCNGSEESLLECSYGVYRPGYCGIYEHVYISCRPERCESLIPSLESEPNPVEFFSNDSYYVCADGFTDYDGQVVCRENTGTYFITRDSLERSTLNGSNELYPFAFQCVGNEDSLCECNTTVQNCSSNQVAQVHCNVLETGTVRHNYATGLLEVYVDGWGYVCSLGWDLENSHTVCRQLGHRRAISYNAGQLHTNFEFLISDVRCKGNQLHIRDCSYKTTHYCTSTDHLSISCESDGCESLLPNLEGTLQISYYYTNKEWHFICGSTMTMKTANVICRENSNSSAISYKSVPHFGLSNFSIYDFEFNCNGTEDSLCDCSVTNQACPSMEIAEIQCNLPENGEVRLSEGHQGIVDYYENGWGFACGYSWNQVASDVVCNSLGFRRAQAGYQLVYRDEDSDTQFLAVQYCFGNESSILDCSLYTYYSYCSEYYHVYITCEANGCESFAPYAEERSIPVEYYTDSTWYYICDSNTNDSIADVICMENGNEFHQSTQPIPLADLPENSTIYPYSFNCTGAETSLCNCSTQPQECISGNALAVKCVRPENGAIRLTRYDQGTLQLYNDGWQPVCDYHTYYIYYFITQREYWAGPESDVACRTLNFRRARDFSLPYNFATNSDYADFRCLGDEIHLSQCENITFPACYETVQLSCETDGCESFLPYGDERLVKARYYSEQSWYYICADGFTEETANVICRENGHTHGVENITSFERTAEDYSIYPRQHNCIGDENSLCDCPETILTCGNYAAMVKCRRQEVPPIRLTDISSGLLLAQDDEREWGYVCSINWNQHSSDIACRQLGYPNANSFSIQTSDFDLDYPSHIAFDSCNSSIFNNIYECGNTYITGLYSICGNFFVSLECQTDDCVSYLLEDGNSAHEVVVYAESKFSYICGGGLTPAAGRILCLEMGYYGVKSIRRNNAAYTTEEYPILQVSYECDGSEERLCECSITTNNTCNNNEIAAVECYLPESGDLRLSDGSEGILEIYYNSSWGYVCDDYFGIRDADVACRTLGFKSASSYSLGEVIQNRPLDPKINNLGCYGTEQTISDCYFIPATTSNCYYYEHVRLYCEIDPCDTFPQISSSSPTPVQVFDSEWQYLCGEGFTIENTEVVCRENAQTYAITSLSTPLLSERRQYSIANNVYNCTGSEQSLCECPSVNTTCDTDMIAVVRCNSSANGDLRLSGGHEGLLEVYNNGWGYACDDYWDKVDSDVACRILGFRRAANFEVDTSHPESTSNFNIDDVQCTGNETNILDCPHSNVHNCAFYEHILLTCAVDGCEAYAHDSEDTTAVVQYYNGQTWYYLCHDSFTEQNANVICEENFGTDAESFTSISATDVPYGYEIFSYRHECVGNEVGLCYCPTLPHNCTSMDVVAIMCQRPEYGSLRLSNGSEGYLEIYLGYDWGFVCEDSFYSYYYYYYGTVDEDSIADLACQQLGYPSALSNQRTFYNPYYTYTLNLVLYDCDAETTRLADCSGVTGSVYCDYRWSLVCQLDSCSTYPAITSGTPTPIQVFNDGFHYVCAEGFDQHTAQVVCRENAQVDALTYFGVNLSIPANQYTFAAFSYECNGTEQSLCECSQTPSTCESGAVAIVHCDLPVNGLLRLSHGHEGLLEVYNNGWGYVCDDFWDKVDSDVACRTLGFRRASSFESFQFHPNLTSEFSIDNVQCTGDEINILDCPHEDLHDCGYYEHIYLTCEVDGCEALAQNSDSSSAVVQYFNGQNWYYLCGGDEFSEENANVICHENFGTEVMYSELMDTTNLTFGYEVYPYQHTCKGSEASLCYCPITPSNCTSSQAVAVMCKRPEYGTLRLSNVTEGYLEVYLGYDWGFVCEDFYYYYFYYYYYNEGNSINDDRIADLACQQIGYAGAVSYEKEYYGQYYTYTANIFPFGCDQTTTVIANCSNSYESPYCPFRWSLVCQTDGCSVFHSSSDSLTQLARTYVDKSVLYICYDQFTPWDADVYCHEIFGTDSTNYSSVPLLNAPMQLSIYDHSYECDGNEETLCECPIEMEQCQSNQVSEVECREPNNGSVRLTDLDSGEIQVYIDGWLDVCIYYSSWTKDNADVTCRSAGFRAATSYAVNYEGAGPNSHSVYDVLCLGNEESLANCDYKGNDDSSYYYYYYYYCYAKPNVTCATGGCEAIVGDAGQSQQVVRYYSNSSWYYICTDEFDDQVGNVICSENGYGAYINSTTILASSLDTEFYIYPYTHICTGNEKSLCECNSVEPGTDSGSCPSGMVVAIQCTAPAQGSVQLSEGSSGSVSVYDNGWKKLCDYNTGQSDADLICRLAGYRNAISYDYNYVSAVSTDIADFIRYIDCIGNEKNLLLCEHYNSYSCFSETIITCEANGCEAHVQNPLDLEILNIYDGSWYTLCAEGFAEEVGKIVCRELDHGDFLQHTTHSILSTDYPISPVSYTCNGEENSICDCEPIQTSCNSDQIVSIQCTPPEQGHIRLTNGTSGLLEIYNGGWKIACNYNYYWSEANSDVVCRYLGYRDAILFNELYEAVYDSSELGLKAEFFCYGYEASLNNCVSVTTNYCYYNYFISCRTEGCQSYVSELDSTATPVLYYKDEQWFYLRDSSIGLEEAHVICRENGYENGAKSVDGVPKSLFDTQYMVYPNRFSCIGNESSLCSCAQSEITTTETIAVVTCAEPDQGTLRYSIFHENMLEVYDQYGWSLVCDQDWSEVDSLVACKQLGYSQVEYQTYIFNGYLNTYIGNFTNVDCVGDEQNIYSCNHTHVACLETYTYYSYYTGEYITYEYHPGNVILYCTSGDCEVHAPRIDHDYHIVEFFEDGERYYICADGFTDESADVVCRDTVHTSSLGFRNVSELQIPPNTKIYPIRRTCVGTEASLCNCSIAGEGCPSESVVEVQCGKPENGTIRISSVGNFLEIFFDGWEFVCASYFGEAEAKIACRELGYPTYNNWYYVYYASLEGEFNLRNFDCIGEESSLVDCPFNAISNCFYPVELVCESGYCESIASNATEPTPVRYFDGHANYYLCGETFTIAVADVVCRENYHGDAIAILNGSIATDGPNFAISRNKYTCEGDENSLCNCTYTSNECPNDLIALVQCAEPEFGQIRFKGPDILEVYYDGIWRDVCYNRWDLADTSVACRQLGYRGSQEETITYYSYYFNSLAWINDIACFGNESRLVDCPHHIGSFCSSYQLSRINCIADGCESFAPSAESFPQVVRYYDTKWYYLSSKGFTKQNADVVCRENGGTTSMTDTSVDIVSIDEKLPILQRTFQCVGNEFSLCDCESTDTEVLSDNVVEIQCTRPNNGDVRLNTEGVVEIYFHEWGYVCDDSWDKYDADVACRQLGYSRSSSSNTEVLIENRDLPYLIDDVECTGDEEKLIDCTHTSRHNCGSGEHVQISCETTVAPVITYPAEDIEMTVENFENFPLIYECTATGVPTPDVNWVDPLTNDISDSPTLTITSPLPPSTTYVRICKAINEVGEDSVSITIHVEVPTAVVVNVLIDGLDNEVVITPEHADEVVNAVEDTVNAIIATNNTNNEVLTNLATVVESAIDKTNGTLSNETGVAITNTLSTIIDSAGDLEAPVTPVGSVAAAPTAVVVALRTLEKFATRLLEEILESGGVSVVKSGSILIITQVVSLSSITSGDTVSLPMATGEEYPVTLSLPLAVAEFLATSDGRLAIGTSIIRIDPTLTANQGSTFQASDILAITLVGNDGKVEFDSEVSLSFTTEKDTFGGTLECVFLDGNNWESEGITTVIQSGVTVCKTFHFTSFAVFVTPYSPQLSPEVELALSIISYILISISFLFLIASLILFIAAGKAFFKIETNIVYFNYCISMLLATGIFLFGVESGKFNRAVCMIVAFLLHYTWLAVFTWTLCIGILIMYKLVISVMSTRKIYPYLIVFGWVFPLIIPTITIVITNSYYVDETQHCFLNTEGGVIWSFIAPVFIILLINLIFLVIAIAKIIYTKWSNQNNEHKDVVRGALITALILTPILGIPWLILILNAAIEHVVLQFIFIFLNGSIGLVFFFVVVLRNKEVRAFLCRRKKDTSTGQTPSGPTSSATASSQVSSKFRKQGTQIGTLEKAMAKEDELEKGAANDCFEKSGTVEDNIYYDADIDKSIMEAAENPPPAYANPSLEADVTANPVYGQSWIGFDDSMNVSASIILENPTYESVGTENPYEVDV